MKAGSQPNSDNFRDSYGFEVKKEYQNLHAKYAPLWEKEEEERRQRWSGFLSGFQDGSASVLREHHGDSEAALEAALLQLQKSDREKEDLNWWKQLRTLVQAGVPMSLRGRLWRTFLQTQAERRPGAYEALVTQSLAPQYHNSQRLEDAMPSLTDLTGDEAGATNPPAADASSSAAEQAAPNQGAAQDWTVQIEKDLHRTFPGHPVMDRSGRRSLRRILAAYACRNPSVGYCQGMNFVAGCLLLFMEEEDAFWCLTVIIEQLLLGYFSTTMVAPQVDQLVFKQLVDKQFPRLTTHLEQLGVNVASVSTQWFLCVFVNSLPLETCLRVWDIFLFERCSSVLFRVALALVDIYAQALVATVDSVDAFSLLQNMAPLSFDSSRLVDVACIAYSHVDHNYMTNLRKGFETSVKAQVQERLDRRSKRQQQKLSAEISGADDGLAAPSPAHFLPPIQVASPRTTELRSPHTAKDGSLFIWTVELVESTEIYFFQSAAMICRRTEPSFQYSWQASETLLSLSSSKAAATAYKIASSPAASTEAGKADTKVGWGEEGAFADEGKQPGKDLPQMGPQLASKPASEAPTSPRKLLLKQCEMADLDHQIHEVLDRRKHDLLESANMSDEERAAVVRQLTDLVARLEEERFQVEERRFEAEQKASMLLSEMEDLRGALRQRAEAAEEHHASLAALQERLMNEAKSVAAGEKRCLQYSTSLRNAEANRALRASLLAEKHELISSLQQELGQGSSQSRSKLLQKLRLPGWSRTQSAI